MLSLILILLLIWFVLVVFLAAWTLWFQAYIYIVPVEGLAWRGPAAGTAVALTVFLWTFLDYRAPGQYTTLWQFNPSDDFTYSELRVVTREGKEEVYKRVKRGDHSLNYQFEGRPLPTRPEKIVTIEPDGAKATFVPDRDEKGNFQTKNGRSLAYRDEKGRIMEDGQLGRITTFYFKRLVLNFFLNLLHFIAWFAALWFLLRFQPWHAFGLAMVLWSVMVLFIVPQVLGRAEQVALEHVKQ